MTESKLFISSCNRRELHRRRRSGPRPFPVARLPALVALVGLVAFLVGRFGL